MVQSKDQATIDNLRPKTVTHENSMLWASLKQCMQHNEELRKALLDAAEVITKQTDLIEELQHRYYV